MNSTRHSRSKNLTSVIGKIHIFQTKKTISKPFNKSLPVLHDMPAIFSRSQVLLLFGVYTLKLGLWLLSLRRYLHGITISCPGIMLAGTHLKNSSIPWWKIVFFRNRKNLHKSVLKWKLFAGEHYKLGKKITEQVTFYDTQYFQFQADFLYSFD